MPPSLASENVVAGATDDSDATARGRALAGWPDVGFSVPFMSRTAHLGRRTL